MEVEFGALLDVAVVDVSPFDAKKRFRYFADRLLYVGLDVAVLDFRDVVVEDALKKFDEGIRIADADDGLFEEREVLNGRHDELLHWRRLLHGWF